MNVGTTAAFLGGLIMMWFVGYCFGFAFKAFRQFFEKATS